MSKDLIDEIRKRPGGEDLAVITDDIAAPSLVPEELKGQARSDKMAQVALDSFKAGRDIILAMDGRAIPTIVRTVAEAADADTAVMNHLNKAVERVNRLRTALTNGPNINADRLPLA